MICGQNPYAHVAHKFRQHAWDVQLAVDHLRTGIMKLPVPERFQMWVKWAQSTLFFLRSPSLCVMFSVSSVQWLGICWLCLSFLIVVGKVYAHTFWPSHFCSPLFGCFTLANTWIRYPRHSFTFHVGYFISCWSCYVSLYKFMLLRVFNFFFFYVCHLGITIMVHWALKTTNLFN